MNAQCGLWRWLVVLPFFLFPSCNCAGKSPGLTLLFRKFLTLRFSLFPAERNRCRLFRFSLFPARQGRRARPVLALLLCQLSTSRASAFTAKHNGCRILLPFSNRFLLRHAASTYRLGFTFLSCLGVTCLPLSIKWVYKSSFIKILVSVNYYVCNLLQGPAFLTIAFPLALNTMLPRIIYSSTRSVSTWVKVSLCAIAQEDKTHEAQHASTARDLSFDRYSRHRDHASATERDGKQAATQGNGGWRRRSSYAPMYSQIELHHTTFSGNKPLLTSEQIPGRLLLIREAA
jgi:hypothetical protein